MSQDSKQDIASNMEHSDWNQISLIDILTGYIEL